MFSVMAWNVEHFKGGTARLNKVVKHIENQDPDVFALFEIEKFDVQTLMEEKFPTYDFNLTDGPQSMETLVGHRHGVFQQAVFTQKREFKAFNPSLRPGALLSVKHSGNFYNLLFLHTDSGTGAPDFGNRQEMFGKINKMRKRLNDIASDSNGRLVVLGDLNTMGLFYPTRRRSDQLVTGAEEIKALNKSSAKVEMSIVAKEFSDTFNNGKTGSRKLISDLDHVIISDEIQLNSLGTLADGSDWFVNVKGWQQLSGNAQKKFIDDISDHCSLLIEIDT